MKRRVVAVLRQVLRRRRAKVSLRSGRILWLLRVYSRHPVLSHGYVLIEVLIALLIFGFIANSFMELSTRHVWATRSR